nr:hypothetical protein [uncultured Cohaesibacter sp.]
MKKSLSVAALAAAMMVCGAAANAEDTVRFWYHFDNADNPMADLVAKFEQRTPALRSKPKTFPGIAITTIFILQSSRETHPTQPW